MGETREVRRTELKTKPMEEENQQDRQSSQAIEFWHCWSDKVLLISLHYFATLDNYSVRFLGATSVKPWNFVHWDGDTVLPEWATLQLN
jgi:hypothetical protein